MSEGRSLELFFVDGRADGLLTAEVFNWTGAVIRTPRTQVKEALALKGARHTGVYLLIGHKDDEPLAYVGEAEDIGLRLKQHVQGKDWWDTAVLITTSADALHKAHVKYLESRLVETAKRLGHSPLENANIPPRSSLNPAAEANMESFLDVLEMVLPAIGITLFVDKTRDKRGVKPVDQTSSTDEVFEMNLKKHGISARARFEQGEIIVTAGSKARKEWIGDRSKRTSYWQIHDDLRNSGVLQLVGDVAVFTKDYAFSSPSAASAVIAGRSDNGRTSWRHVQSGMTYAAWETAQIEVENPTP